MCGIIGYKGNREAQPILLESLKKLEYRGYDSAGIAIIDKKLKFYRETGEISALQKNIPKMQGTIGIGHTRWATHGSVKKENAHPQISMNKKIAVAHNGIIENFMQLKQELLDKGYKFTSQTDTEVIAHLIQDNYHGNLKEAITETTKKIQGSYALVVISEDEPDTIIGARKESPLVVGIADNETFIASDIPAFLKYTNKVLYLDDNTICKITKKTITLYDEHDTEIHKEPQTIQWDVKDAEKSGFPHFMLKEIYDQPTTINQVLQGRVSEIERSITFHETIEHILKRDYGAIHIIACGTSFYAGLIGKNLIEQITDIPVTVDIASEYRYYGQKKRTNLVIAITQSGETTDTLAALKDAKKKGSTTLVITNVIGSTATTIADGYLLTQSGPEIGVAATKTFTAQITLLFLLSLKIAGNHHAIGPDEIYKYILDLKTIPQKIRYILNNQEEILNVAQNIHKKTSIFFIGRGINYPLALEGALKLKEISYIHAEGYAAGELKHGPFALLTKETPVIALINKDKTYDKMITNIGEIKARGSPVIALAEDTDTETEKYVDYIIRYPNNKTPTYAIPLIVILQLLAYYIADLRGCSIDKPRNLAKSVTVD